MMATLQSFKPFKAGAACSCEPLVEITTDDAIEFRGDDSETSYLQGARDFAVELDIDNEDFTVIEMPKTDEDDSPTVTVPVTDGGSVVVQPHALRTGGKESFAFFEFSFADYLTYQ